MTAMPAADAAAIFAGVKDAASKKAWAAGVALARTAAVAFARRDGGDWHYTVTTPSNGVAIPCMVNPEEEDWLCQSKEADDPSRYVVALVIALQKSGGKIAAPDQPPLRLGYFFCAKAGALHCDRAFFDPSVDPSADPSSPSPQLAVTASLKTHRPDFAVQIAAADIDLDPWLCHLGLSSGDGEAIPATSMASIFAVLAAHRLPAFWQQRPVAIHKAPYPEAIAITDAGDGVVVKLSGQAAAERFSNGAVLAGSAGHQGLWLPPASAAAPLPAEAKWLAGGRRFKSYELAYLVSELLPALSERFTIHSGSQRLPRLVKERPRPAFYCEAKGDELTVMPGIVYGDPAIAKVEKKALLLTGGDCPERDRSGEYAISDTMGRKLAMTPGDALSFSGTKAQVMAERIAAFAKTQRGLLYSRHPRTGRWQQDHGGKLTADPAQAGGQSVGLSAFKSHGPLTPHISLGGDDFSLSFKVGGREVDPAAVFAAFRAGESNLPLMGGGFAPLPRDWLGRYGPALAQLWQAKLMAGGKKTLPRSLWPSYLTLAKALDPSFEPSTRLSQLSAALTAKAPRAPLPPGLKATLRPYQQEGVDWLRLRQQHKLGGILADDMGLGKTLQTICTLPADGPSLVVCPTSVLFNWQRELSRFRPQLTCRRYHGSSRDLAADLGTDLNGPKNGPKNKGLTLLTSYGTLRRDVAKLAAVPWQMVVLDEAQTIKNPASQVSQAAFQLKAPFKLALTGTPIENSLLDLWSQFQFLLPGFLGDHKPFAAALGSADQAAHSEVVSQKIAPFLLRRTKKQVLTDLPEKIESLLYYELNEAERQRYDALYAAGQPKVQKLLLGGGKLEILEIILRLRQACCHPRLGQPDNSQANQDQEDSLGGKLRPLLEKLGHLRASGGGKSLIFSQWTGFLSIIERRLKAEGFQTVRLDGQTQDRGKVVASFQDDPATEIMLISLKAGSTGLNLTAAENVFIMDPWWNPAIENQAADRAYRIGQKNTVQIFRIVALNTIEENIVVLKDAKQQLADSTLGQGFATSHSHSHGQSHGQSHGHELHSADLESLFS